MATVFGVVVQNLSDNVENNALSEFFGFCGELVNIERTTSSRAHIYFQSHEAAQTALLLDDSFLRESRISVTPLPTAEDLLKQTQPASARTIEKDVNAPTKLSETHPLTATSKSSSHVSANGTRKQQVTVPPLVNSYTLTSTKPSTLTLVRMYSRAVK